MKLRKRPSSKEMFAGGSICLSTEPIHTVKPLKVNIPKGRLTVVTGVSGSGKTTLGSGKSGPGSGSGNRQKKAAEAYCFSRGRRH